MEKVVFPLLTCTCGQVRFPISEAAAFSQNAHFTSLSFTQRQMGFHSPPKSPNNENSEMA